MMFNLFEIIRSAQGGAALENVARQFSLSQQQAQRAIEALLPAFTVGLQRASQDPLGLMGMFGLIGQGGYLAPFEDAARAFSAAGRAQGNDVLAQIFGSPEVSRQVAAQAAAVSGVSQEIMKQMLPVLAAMLMGGIAKSAGSQGLGDLLQEIGDFFNAAAAKARGGLSQEAAARRGTSAAPPDLFRQWSEMLQSGSLAGMMPGARPASPPPQQEEASASGAPHTPLEDMFQAFVGALAGMQRAAEPPAPEPEPEQPQAPFDREAIGRMFEAGRDIQEQQTAAMRAILEGFAKGRG